MNETGFRESVVRKVLRVLPSTKHVKFNMRFSNGWPDSGFFAAGGKTLWVEWKVHPNKLSPLQELVIKDLTEKGHKVAVITYHKKEAKSEITINGHTFWDMANDWIVAQLQ
jgi:hypothetical protein